MKITDKITVTNEDNMKLMARYPDKYFDLAIVDPPYGADDAIGLIDNKKKGKQATKRKEYALFDNKAPENEYFHELVRISKNQIVWGGNYLGLCGGVIVWNKNGTAFGEGEVAICSTHKSVQIFEYTWNGMLQGDMKNKEVRIHPTQKPAALYKWILEKYSKPNFKIIDTHFGSGSIAIGFDQMLKYWNSQGLDIDGAELVACEINEEYFNASVKRIKDELSQLTLF